EAKQKRPVVNINYGDSGRCCGMAGHGHYLPEVVVTRAVSWDSPACEYCGAL
ncbi:hypothetical protein J6590_016746, partial [Homalodisca vitripennis]